MKSKSIARRLSDIHSLAIRESAEKALRHLRHFRHEIMEEEIAPDILAEAEERIIETELYILMKSSENKEMLIDVLRKMIESIDTPEKRKIETIILGLEHVKKTSNIEDG